MFELNFRDSKPIYEQIKDALRKLIVTGVMTQDEKLPSVRELASSKALNPNTIQRAYRELEAEGYIYSIPGKGSFVAPQDEVIGKRQEELMPQFETVVRELMEIGISSGTLKTKVDEVYGRNEK